MSLKKIASAFFLSGLFSTTAYAWMGNSGMPSHGEMEKSERMGVMSERMEKQHKGERVQKYGERFKHMDSRVYEKAMEIGEKRWSFMKRMGSQQHRNSQ